MNPSESEIASEAATIDPHATLFVPLRRRFNQHYVQTPEGKQELVIYFGDKEISFDEPELFSFGESLFKQDSFMAGSATTWSQGEPLPWERVRGLLQDLVAAGIVATEQQDRSAHAVLDNPNYKRHLEHEANRDTPKQPLWWNPDCGPIFEKLTGRPLELGYIESVIPVHRLAHPAFDADQRHVGEMNVFPERMRMQVPTETRVCKYPGGRYEYDLPMNITALNTMRKHWRAMMRGTLEIRAEVLRRYPLGPSGVWSLGDLHALACCELAMATLLVMKADDPVKNGDLDPVLSSIYRVSDGVRMVAVYALFFIDEQRVYDSPMSAAELLRVTEARDHFLSDKGVCAGPPNMVADFFATLIDGKPLEGEQPPLGDWVKEIPRAVDYGLLGVELYSILFNLFVRMALAYDKVHDALLRIDPAADSPLGKLRKRIDHDWAIIQPGHLDRPAQRALSEARYTVMLDRAQRGIRGFREEEMLRMEQVFQPAPGLLGEGALQSLQKLLLQRTGQTGPNQTVEEIAFAVLEYLRTERTVLRSVVAVQKKINALLERPNPTRPFSGLDLGICHILRRNLPGGLPYLMHMFSDVLGIEVENTESSTRIRVDSHSIDLA